MGIPILYSFSLSHWREKGVGILTVFTLVILGGISQFKTEQYIHVYSSTYICISAAIGWQYKDSLQWQKQIKG